MNVLCCQVEIPATGRSIVQRSPSECVLCVIVKPGPGPLAGCCARGMGEGEPLVSVCCVAVIMDTSVKKNSLSLLGTEPQSVGSWAYILVTMLTELLSLSTTNTCNILM